MLRHTWKQIPIPGNLGCVFRWGPVFSGNDVCLASTRNSVRFVVAHADASLFLPSPRSSKVHVRHKELHRKPNSPPSRDQESTCGHANNVPCGHPMCSPQASVTTIHVVMPTHRRHVVTPTYLAQQPHLPRHIIGHLGNSIAQAATSAFVAGLFQASGAQQNKTTFARRSNLDMNKNRLAK